MFAATVTKRNGKEEKNMNDNDMEKMVDNMIAKRENAKSELEKELELLKIEAIRAGAIREFAERWKESSFECYMWLLQMRYLF